MSGASPAGAARPRSWLRWLLLASLIVNGLLGGYVLGRVFMPPPPPVPGAPGMAGSPAAGLPAPLREAVRKELSHAEVKKRMQAIRAAHGAIREAIQADPFDRARLDQAFNALAEGQTSLQRDLHRAASAAVERMSLEERKRLAEWRPEGRERRSERHGPR